MNMTSTKRPDQTWDNITIKALNGEAVLYITKNTGDDYFRNYTVNFYDSWINVKVGNTKYWYPIKELLGIREENNFIVMDEEQKSLLQKQKNF